MTHDGLPRASTPTRPRTEIREALSGNLCRCTGYQHIVEAVLLAASGSAGQTAVTRYIGRPIPQRGRAAADRPRAVRGRRAAAGDAARGLPAQRPRACRDPVDRCLRGARRARRGRGLHRRRPRRLLAAGPAAGAAAADPRHDLQPAHAGAAGEGQGAPRRRADGDGGRREPLHRRGRARRHRRRRRAAAGGRRSRGGARCRRAAACTTTCASNVAAARASRRKGDYAAARAQAPTWSSRGASATTAARRRRSRTAPWSPVGRAGPNS